MTAKEIREQYKGGNDLQVDVLMEIAAQLAELNENYKDFKKTLSSNGAIDVNVRQQA